MNPTPLAREFNQDDPDFVRGLLEHHCREAISRLFETINPEDAHWIATTAIVEAERKARKHV